MKKKAAANGVSPNGSKPNTPQGKKQQKKGGKNSPGKTEGKDEVEAKAELNKPQTPQTPKNKKPKKKGATPQKNGVTPQKKVETPQIKAEAQEKKVASPQKKTVNKADNGLLEANSRKRKIDDEFFKCFRCNGTGHRFSECPEIPEADRLVGCYNCGSTEHKLSKCPKKDASEDRYSFATCFRCHKKGHLVRDCPAVRECNNCGSTDHLVAKCPEYKKQKIEKGVIADVIEEDENPDATEASPKPAKKAKKQIKSKTVKF